MSDACQKSAWGSLGEPMAGSGFARLAHSVETPAATLRHALYGGGVTVPLHRHDRDVLVYGVGGPCIEYGAGQMIKRRLTFHPRGYEHRLYFENATHVVAIEIPNERTRLAHTSTALPATLYDLVWSAMLKVADDQPVEAVSRALADLLDASERFLRNAPPLWLMEVIDHLHKHWREVQSTSAIAERFGVSPQHLCRAFKQRLGVTIGQYSLALRIDYARGLLWGSDLPICEVAAETGFFDQAHLTRVLGLRSERTPARLRWTAPRWRMDETVPAIA